MSPRARTVAAVLLFCVLGLAAYWPIYPGDPSRLPSCACGDQVQSTWFLSWVPYAVLHGHNPFFTSWINGPVGANLAQNTLMPMLGLFAMPVTLVWGPVASFNLLAWLAFPLSASSMYFVMKRVTGRQDAAFVAGLMYGFSPYIVGQARGHIMLSFVPLPPLICWVSWEIIVVQRRRAGRLGLLLAGLIIAQFLIEPEVLALVAIGIGLALACGLAHGGLLSAARLRYCARAVGVAACTTALALAYPVWFMLAGPQHFTGSNFPLNNQFHADLLGLVLPSSNQQLVPGIAAHFATTTGGDITETGDYIGIALLCILLVSAIRFRHNRGLKVACLAGLAAWVLSLGPHLVVGTRTSSIPLPFDLLGRLPLAENILPGRFALDMWLGASVASGICVIEWRAAFARLDGGTWRRTAWNAVAVVCLVAAAAALVPRWPYSSEPLRSEYQVAKDAGSVPTDTTVLAYPYPMPLDDRAMLWQAIDGMKFRLLGAYIQNPGPQGRESQTPAALAPLEVEAWLSGEQGSVGTPWPATTTVPSPQEMRNFVTNNHVGAVVLDRTAQHASTVAAVLRSALGPPQVTTDATMLWLRSAATG